MELNFKGAMRGAAGAVSEIASKNIEERRIMRLKEWDLEQEAARYERGREDKLSDYDKARADKKEDLQWEWDNKPKDPAKDPFTYKTQKFTDAEGNEVEQLFACKGGKCMPVSGDSAGGSGDPILDFINAKNKKVTPDSKDMTGIDYMARDAFHAVSDGNFVSEKALPGAQEWFSEATAPGGIINDVYNKAKEKTTDVMEWAANDHKKGVERVKSKQ